MGKTIKDFQEYEGVDASLEISLFEYGLIWAKGIKDHENDYHFIYGVDGRDKEGKGFTYTMFDWGDIPIDCNPEKEWNWVNWKEVADSSGMSKKDFLKMPLPMIVESLISYYGHENIFGSSYYPFEILEEDEIEND